MRWLGWLMLAAALAACDRAEVRHGAALYRVHCAQCHGAEGAGQNPAKPWGSLDPAVEGHIAPALDGRGHCADHPRQVLMGMIADGTQMPGSPMPSFRDRLSEADRAALVAYLESLWGRATRRRYEQREQELARESK